MRAMVLDQFGGRLQLKEVPDPAPPGPGQVLVRVRACGLCYTDVKIASASLPGPLLPRLPHILGHEPAGEVVAVGEGVMSVAPGDHVALHIYLPCGRCRACWAGDETLCDSVRQLGFNLPGAMAEYVVVPEINAVRIGQHVPLEEAAIIADAVATTVHGLRERAGLRVGETVLVIGAGGLGLHAIQVARLGGARVLAVDQAPDKLELARKVGADDAFLIQSEHAAKQVLAAAGGPVDLVVELVAKPVTMSLAAAVLRTGGRLLMIGYQPGVDVAIPTPDVVLRNLSIIGSTASSLLSFRESVRLVEQGKIRPVVTDRYRLEEANEALERLKRGGILGRAVLLVA
ncbi:alcohol dehydrogenase catalytic domain-containing protein [Geochorda subterranea]|uniref:Alcohol dehydrogenase catalytic domain-containing protein n=1 Tax=Geochorda subterranea TaxID=3109564 RepID=A0ABZ1BQY5_9FIRM|nr:alcohol dehydrogenase catalytic domain-containing protein [Limnochorda sp. LNt]WRP15030.1 alcohol dehydrogenase catalytic domain-containing protein [Limnochorda sp. LNt]